MDKNIIEYDFPKAIKSNYLKVISNLFYLTLLSSSQLYQQKLMKGEFTDHESKKNFIRDSYMSNLVLVRERVIKFFKLEDDSMITIRTLLRVYPYALSETDEIKIKYIKLNKMLDSVESNMSMGIFAEEFVDPEDRHYYNDVLNEERDFDRLLEKTVQLNSVY